MKNLKMGTVLVVMIVVSAIGVTAHPHFNKSVIVKLPEGTEATITYNTTPANERYAQEAAVGSFLTPRRPQLKLSAELKIGDLAIAAGEYTLGVIKNGDDDWTMALYPGQIPRQGGPDMSKMIKLESMYSSTQGTAAHMLIDITPGHGKFEGRAVLTLHFGSMFLAGALS